MLEQMTKELPDCVLPESGSLIDPEYFVNEYLIRNGYFDDMQSLREENRELKRDRVLMEKEIRNLRSSLRQLDEDLIGTRRRAVNLEETTGSLRSSYEERLCQASCREAELLSIVHRQKAEISRLSNSSSADVSSGRVAHDSSKSTQITSLRDSIKSSQSTIVRDPIRSITTGNAAPDNIKSAEPSHMEGSKQDMTSERISSEDIMRGLTSLHIDF